VSCILDSDCPATWTCATVGGTSSGCAGAARILPDGGIQEIPPVCDPAPPTTTIKQCVPPYYGSGFGKAGSSVNEAGSGTTGNGSIPPRGADPIDVGGNPSVPPSSSSGGETGGHVTAPAADPGNGTSSDNGSCQMSVGHASTTGASLLALLGIAGMARRRRTRWG
jgi:MYXO-CTERM domain-containing protein